MASMEGVYSPCISILDPNLWAADTDSREGTVLKSTPSVHTSPYLTNSLEPAKCDSQLFSILRLSLDLAGVQHIVSL